MSPKEVITLIRNAVALLNTTPAFKTDIALEREDHLVISDFIAFCKTMSDTVEVPQIVSDAWNAIPDEWLNGELPEPTAENGYDPCGSFGKQSARSKACKACQKTNVDEHIRCAKATEMNKKPVKEPAGTSRFGHVLGSKSAFIDDLLVDGISEADLIAALQKQWPEMTETTARNKERSHISWLPRVRGVQIQITKTDEGLHYKAMVDHWCGSKDKVIEVTNIHDDQRSATIEKAEKKAAKDAEKAEKAAKKAGEKKVKEAKAAVKRVKGEKKAKPAEPSEPAEPAAE